MASSSSQKAGSNSVQQIIGTQIVGITEERATEIARLQCEQSIREIYIPEAQSIARQRMDRVDQKIIAKLAAQELLDIFGDPSFLTAVHKAHMSAAQSASEDDYEILASLIAERAATDASVSKTALVRAVEVVDLIDEEALAGLTALWVIGSISPVAPEAATALRTLDGVYSKTIDTNLPAGDWWLEHLDSLNLVRIDRSRSFIKMPESLLRNYPSWICKGFTAEEREQAQADLHAILQDCFESSAFADHAYRPGYYRLTFPSINELLESVNAYKASSGDTLNEEDHQKIEAIFADYFQPDEDSHKLFLRDLSNYQDLHRVYEWWNGMETYASVSHVGTALAYTNARRFDPLIGLMTLEKSLRRNATTSR